MEARRKYIKDKVTL